MSEDRRQVHEGNMLLLLVIPQPQGQSDSLLVQPTLGRSATLSACWGPSIVSRIRTGLGLQDGGVTLHRLPPWDSGTLLLQLLGKTPPPSESASPTKRMKRNKGNTHNYPFSLYHESHYHTTSYGTTPHTCRTSFFNAGLARNSSPSDGSPKMLIDLLISRISGQGQN